jgi:epsilon-lactone hydrolase
MLSSQAQNVIAMLRAFPRKPVSRENVPKMRHYLDAGSVAAPEGAEFRAIDVGGIPAVWVRYGEVDSSRRLLYLHGGAYAAGSRRTHGSLAAHLSRAAGCAVLLTEYRLAPENPFPAAVEDAVAALQWIEANGPAGKAPAKGVFVAGDSAGGALTFSALVSARDAGRSLPKAAVTLSAWTDLAATGDSLRTRADADPWFSAQTMAPLIDLYLAGAPATHPLASPLYAKLNGLPPLLMHVGDAEILLDDTLRVAERAKAAGVDVTLEVFPELFHVFHLYAGLVPEATEAVARIGDFLRRHG